MCKELVEIYEKMNPEHKNALLSIAKNMQKNEEHEAALKNLLAISK